MIASRPLPAESNHNSARRWRAAAPACTMGAQGRQASIHTTSPCPIVARRVSCFARRALCLFVHCGTGGSETAAEGNPPREKQSGAPRFWPLEQSGLFSLTPVGTRHERGALPDPRSLFLPW
jgi:hypothetical protein